MKEWVVVHAEKALKRNLSGVSFEVRHAQFEEAKAMAEAAAQEEGEVEEAAAEEPEAAEEAAEAFGIPDPVAQLDPLEAALAEVARLKAALAAQAPPPAAPSSSLLPKTPPPQRQQPEAPPPQNLSRSAARYVSAMTTATAMSRRGRHQAQPAARWKQTGPEPNKKYIRIRR